MTSMRAILRPCVCAAVLLAAAAPAAGDGACCLFGDTCVPAADDAACAAQGGIFLPGQDCSSGPCGVGACCRDVACNQASAFDCISAGRTFVGAGTSCLTDPCAIGFGACCFDDGTCASLSLELCNGGGGTWLGAGTLCSGQCALGACCLPAGACQDVALHECEALGGTFVEGDVCKGDPCLPEGCPGDTLFGQSPDDPDDFVGGTSEADPGLERLENFAGVPGPISGLRFYGFDLDYLGGNIFIECVETDPTFLVRFLTDAGGAPGVEVCSATVTATRIPLGISYLGAELNRYEITLPAPCVLVNGWVSIVGLGDPECWFLWLSAGTASGYSWCDGCSVPQQDFDLAVCLLGEAGGVFGACCDDATGGCVEGVEISDCTAAGLRFAPGAACSDLEPPCGVIVGACCFADATCSILEEAGCAAQKGSWLGANTLCDQCPCVVPCPAGGVAEGEVTCFDGYVDSFNGGCAAAAPAFSPIAPGRTVCATSGVFSLAGEDVPDADWYQVTLDAAADLTFTVEAEFVAQASIRDGNSGCPGAVLQAAAGLSCDRLAVLAEVGRGTYWLVVQPFAFTDEAACGASYRATLSACTGDLDGDGAAGISDLLTLLASWGTPGPGDLDGDGSVGIADLLVLLGAWGPCG